MLNWVLPVLIFTSAFGYITSLFKDWYDFRMLLVHVPLACIGLQCYDISGIFLVG